MIDIQDLHFSYKRKKVFNGLTLHLEAGHIYGLIGKNGTGKSTLLRSLAGLLFPDEGIVRVMGHRPQQRRPSFLRDVFLVPEEFHLPDISIRQLLKYHACFYAKFDREQFEKCIRAFDIPAGGTLQKMSYGQKKKLLISFGLASGVSLLLLDEPTNGLDIVSKGRFRQLIAGSLTEEKCFIISTHQVKDIENLVDQVTVIDEGRILFNQTTDVVSRRLSFKLSFDPQEIKAALYRESYLRGHAIVTENTDADESKADLELLYKAIMENPGRIQQVFNA